MQTVVVFAACGIGILVSSYMLFKKLSRKNLACPREHPCDTILSSRFAYTFGVPNELLGVLYFSFVAFLLLFPVSGSATVWFLWTLFFLIVAGGLFSLYLLGLQAFVIRRWCLWCVGVALTNALLIVSFFNFPIHHIAPLLSAQKTLWVIVHNIGFILGVGAATISDVFFFRFLKDHSISQEEKETMDTLTSVIWVGLALLFISGLALYFPENVRLLSSSKFLIKLVVVGVITINGVLLNMLVAPSLRRLSFEGTVPARRFRRIAFTLGGISIVSWYSAFLLGSLRTITFTFEEALIAYTVLLVIVVIGARWAEGRITRQMNQ